VPWLSISLLSRLTDDPDSWHDALLQFARARPVATMAEHYRALFEWLTSRAGGSVWVERSGSSLDYLGDLAALFPSARFVHIHRDGHEAALSIREHRFFRLGVALFMDLFPDNDDVDAAITQVIDSPPPYWAVGRYWSDQVLHGFAALPCIDRDQFMQVRFEDLVAEPVMVLADIAAFFELDDDPSFPRRAAARVHGRPPERFPTLDPAAQDELRRACRPGQVLLGRA
jgi:putative sulfotransferase